MNYLPINFEKKFKKFSDYWSPKIIAQINNYHLKLVKLKGDFVWHRHKNTDEVFIVLNGKMGIDFPDGRIEMKSGEMFVVPKGVKHKPFADKECEILVIEPAGTRNTGEEKSNFTSEDNVWI